MPCWIHVGKIRVVNWESKDEIRAKYQLMLDVGMSDSAVAQKIKQDGEDPTLLYDRGLAAFAFQVISSYSDLFLFIFCIHVLIIYYSHYFDMFVQSVKKDQHGSPQLS